MTKLGITRGDRQLETSNVNALYQIRLRLNRSFLGFIPSAVEGSSPISPLLSIQPPISACDALFQAENVTSELVHFLKEFCSSDVPLVLATCSHLLDPKSTQSPRFYLHILVKSSILHLHRHNLTSIAFQDFVRGGWSPLHRVTDHTAYIFQ
jgi:hypothetical protein